MTHGGGLVTKQPKNNGSGEGQRSALLHRMQQHPPQHVYKGIRNEVRR